MMIEIPVGKSRYKITCSESEKEKIFHLAERLNQRVNQLSQTLRNADEKTLLVISALSLEEELDGAKTEEHDHDETSKLNDQDLYDAVSENMENIAEYVEKLTKKIQNY